MSEKIDISGLDKRDVLRALYDAAKPQGMGMLQYDPAPLTDAEVERLLPEGQDAPFFDYVKWRVMKVKIAGDDFDPWLFDRDNGSGAARAALEKAGLIAA